MEQFNWLGRKGLIELPTSRQPTWFELSWGTSTHSSLFGRHDSGSMLPTLLENQLEARWVSSRALQTPLLTYTWATRPSSWHLAKRKLSSATDTNGRLDLECTWSYAPLCVLVYDGIPSKMLMPGVWLRWENNFALDLSLLWTEG